MLLMTSQIHHFINGIGDGIMLSQVKRGWFKKVQQEWSILKRDLPDAIYVRVYEERMELMRAAILGSSGTPYHDGLFFFDIFFPPDYPHEPVVCYKSGGLRLNPNLYESGKAYCSEAGFDEEIGKVDGDRNSITRMLSYSRANQCYTCYASHLSILRHSSRSILLKGHIIFSMSARLIWMVHRLVTLTSMEGLPAKLVPLDSKSCLENSSQNSYLASTKMELIAASFSTRPNE